MPAPAFFCRSSFQQMISRTLAVVAFLGVGVWMESAAMAAPPFHGSLFTPVSQKTAIGPPYTAPVVTMPMSRGNSRPGRT